MKELLNAFGYLGIRQVAGVLFGLVRSKVLAAYLGPFGTGMVAQGTSLMRLLQQFTDLGIGSGFLKLIAEYRSQNDKDRVNRTISTVLSLFGMLGFLVVLVSYIFSDQISIWVFDDAKYRWFVVIIAAASWLLVQYNFILTIFRALFQWRQYATVAVVGYALNVITTVGLIIWQGILGAIISILVAQATNFVISLIIFRKSVVIPEDLRFWRYRPNKEIFSRVVRFIGPLTTVAILPVISLLFVSGEIIRQLGAEANGIFQVAWGISVTYMGLILVTLNSYGVPKVTSMISDPKAVRKIQNYELRLGVFVVTPILVGMMALREIWIPLLYSPAFLGAASILIWQFGADFFRVIRQGLNITLLPHEKFGYIYFDGIFFWGGWMLLSRLLIPEFGLPAVPMSYFIVNFSSTLIGFMYQRIRIGFLLSNRNKVLFSKAFLLGGAGVISTHFAEDLVVRVAIAAFILAVMAVWMPTKNEYADLLAFAKTSISKRNPEDLDE